MHPSLSFIRGSFDFDRRYQTGVPCKNASRVGFIKKKGGVKR
jgi:hypothetical protein